MWVLLLMIVIMPFEINPYLRISDSFLGVFPDFTMIKLLGLVGLAWTGYALLTGEARLGILASGQGRAFCLYVGCLVVAALASGAGLRPVTRLLAIVCLLPIVLAAVRNQRALELALKTMTAVLILLFPYAWRQMGRYGGRLGVGVYEPNYLALALVLAVPMAIALGRYETGWRRLFWLGGAVVLVVELSLTGSRGGFLGLTVVLLLVGFRLVRLSFPAVVAWAAVLLVALFTVPNPLHDRILASGLDPEKQHHAVTGSADTRILQAKAGLRMIADHPLAGVGLGNFKTVATSYGAEQNKVAHNTYVELGAEAGVPALLAFLLVVASAWISLGRAHRLAEAAGHERLRDLALALQIGLTGYLISASFLSAEYEKFLWLAVFLSITVERVVEGALTESAQDAPAYGQPAWTAA